jgi:hypothetical protein
MLIKRADFPPRRYYFSYFPNVFFCLLKLLFVRYKKVSASKDLSTKTKAELKSVFGYEPVSVDRASGEAAVDVSGVDDAPTSSKKQKKSKKSKKEGEGNDES